jgi:FMN phosphatase YigB (HAD superfamily)
VTIRAVVFDLFDTLVDLHYEDLPRLEHEGRALPATVGALHAAVAERAEVGFPAFLEALAAVDRELREARYAEGLEVPTEERFVRLLEELGVDDGELPAALTAVHMGMLRSTVAVLGLGLCSNFSHAETALAILEEAGIHALLDVVAISETVGYRKPRPEIFQAVLEAFDLAPGQVLHVGDSLHADVAGAGALGMRTAWIIRRVGEPERSLQEYPGPPPDFSIRDLAEIPALLG